VLANGVLYGTASGGGSANAGTLFSINTNGTSFTNFFTFTGNTNDGSGPAAELLLNGNLLYGTTQGGGKYASGTVFSINTNRTGFTDLHDLVPATDGSGSIAGLTLSGSTLYGVTQTGSTNGNGAVFSLSTSGASFSVQHAFAAGTNNLDGATPTDTLLVYSNYLFGVTSTGGTNASGTLFSVGLPAPVILSLSGSGTNVILTWPNSGYTLQSNSNLNSTAWSNVSPAAVFSGGLFRVTNPITGAKKFYRLSQ
jgi:uncharacterized repeat protein (TIGR03803 family)